MTRPDNNPTNQIDVLDAVVRRLVSQVEQFTENNCYPTAEPLDEIPDAARKSIICTVSPTDGQFEEGIMEGGGFFTPIENAGVEIVVYNALRLDKTGGSMDLLKDASRGLLIIKNEILKALTGHDLLDANNKEILVNLMAPIRSSNPRTVKQDRGRIGDLALTFSTDFEWNLT